MVILNLDFTPELADTNSLQFLQLAEQIQNQVLYMFVICLS